MKHNIQGGIDFNQLRITFQSGKNFQKEKIKQSFFTEEYSELFKRFDNKSIMKLGTRNPETIERMVQNHKEEVLENWYKFRWKIVNTSCCYAQLPRGRNRQFSYISKKWSQLMRIDNYNLNDDGKAAILKASYVMGVFQGRE